MFSSNDTSRELFKLALADGGCILNIDDISMIDKMLNFPELVCFRYNPGERRTGNQIIGIPVEAKYGLRHDQIIEGYKRAMARGAKRFGLHTMIISNERNYLYMVETVRMLLEIMEMVSQALDIKFEFFNIGGGVGIPYRPEDKLFDLPALAREAKSLLQKFAQRQGYSPSLFMECGRYITGPHGCTGGQGYQPYEQIPRIRRRRYFHLGGQCPGRHFMRLLITISLYWTRMANRSAVEKK